MLTLALVLVFPLFFLARRDVEGEGKSCRPPLSISHVPVLTFSQRDNLTCKKKKLNPWIMAKLKESHQARQGDDQRKSSVQQLLHFSADFLRRIIAPVQGQGGVTLSYVCLHWTNTCLKITSGGSRRSIVTAARR